MFEIDRIPTAVIETLTSKGISVTEILLSAYCDRSRDLLPAQTYLLATKDQLLILSGVTALERQPSKTKYSSLKATRAFHETSFEQYSLAELHDFRVEELLSAGRLVAKHGEENQPILLCAFTNFCKASVFLFAKYVEKLAKGEELDVDPKDDPSAKCCPKCGLRYPDANRRICPHCMEKGKLFVRFFSFFGRYRGYLALMLLSLVILTAFSILTPYLSSGFFYDEVISGTGEFAGQILLALGLIVATRVLRLLANIANSLITSTVAPKIVFAS